MVPSRRSLLVILALLLGCKAVDRGTAAAPPTDAEGGGGDGVADAGEPPEGPVEARTISVAGDLPVFYVAGRRHATERMVFLHGACTHGLGYIQSFAFAASARGSLMALQGEHDCGHGLRSWLSSPQQAHSRIEAGFAAANDRASTSVPIIAIGYSQGATVVESLAARYPATYRRLILIGAPRAVDARALRALEGAVLMAGTFDNRAVMQESARALAQVGVPTTFIEIPGARHGQLNEAEAVMGKALAWLEENGRGSDDAGVRP
jgi:alpha-beta hydrolase superfamily lysophospholipase